MPRYKGDGVMTIQGQTINMNKLRDPFKLRDDARAAVHPLPEVLPEHLRPVKKPPLF